MLNGGWGYNAMFFSWEIKTSLKDKDLASLIVAMQRAIPKVMLQIDRDINNHIIMS